MHFTHKNIVLIVVAALIIGGAFGMAEYRNSYKKKIVYSAPVAAVIDQLPDELQTRDSDDDGLKDWEEVLLGTNSQKADTDGDGTSDGKEATGGRNPLVKGPNDKASDTAKSSIAAAELSQTDRLARDFFARYMELSQAGLADDAFSKTELIEQVIKNGVVLSKPKVYEIKDIFITKDVGVNAIRKYGNEVGTLFKKYSDPKARNEVIIAQESADNDDPELLKEIDPIIISYKNILTGLLRISVPDTLSENHLLLINSLSVLAFSAESLRKIDVDTLAGIQGTSVILGGAENLNKAFNTLKSSFTVQNIVFSANEGGSFFISP